MDKKELSQEQRDSIKDYVVECEYCGETAFTVIEMIDDPEVAVDKHIMECRFYAELWGRHAKGKYSDFVSRFIRENPHRKDRNE